MVFNNSKKIIALVASILIFTNCQKTQFRNIAAAPEQTRLAEPTPAPVPVDPAPTPEPVPVPEPTPVPPVVVPPPVVTPPPVVVPTPVVTPQPPPPVVIPAPVQKSGKCASNSSTQLLSCLKCQVPMNPPPPPQFSEKGQALIDVMAIGCSIPNKSAPKGYVAPTKEQLIARLSKLSPQFYPDSQMSDAQKSVIAGLRNDPNLQRKMFAGRWYQPPYSDAFETYFGASVAELVYQICYQSPDANFSPYDGSPIHSLDYMNCINTGSNNCAEKADYVKANLYRKDLRNSMKESILRPYVPPPATPAKKCNWESFEGNYDQGADEVLARWLVSGFKVGMEIGSLGGKCEMVTSLPSGTAEPRGHVKMAAYICK
ncbi:MAG: hypothetical protein H7061_09925 [Bdellovibrionaceae bacterium]|nr:hypothetical protein [Bdellovibrio sp.]